MGAYLSTDSISSAATAALNFDLTSCFRSSSFFLSSLKAFADELSGGKEGEGVSSCVH